MKDKERNSYINTINTLRRLALNIHGVIDAVDDDNCERVISMIENDGWIPVTERFPEEEGCYLVTTTGTYNDVIDIARYVQGIWHKASRIKAWMPLPKPYKEGAEK